MGGAESAPLFLPCPLARRGASRGIDRLQSTRSSAKAASFPGRMITPEYCQLMARYNRWMNERLYGLCAAMADGERKRDRGAFFGSIHGTLNHLLWGDRMWLGRFAGLPCTYPQFGADTFRA